MLNSACSATRSVSSSSSTLGGGRLHIEHPQIAEHLALLRQECRVAAMPGGQADDVLGDLAVQELLGVPAGQCELAALRAVEQSGALGDGGVVDLEPVVVPIDSKVT